jgi:hypothetical protein
MEVMQTGSDWRDWLRTNARALLVGMSLLTLVTTTLGQTTANSLRAQGRYYSAKEAFEKRQYDEAARMLLESRQMLGGKSNVRLQYLLVLSLYNAKRYAAAQTEMNTYLELEVNSKDRYASFPQDVDRLTSDETRAITMLIDKIDAEVAKGSEAQNNAASLQAAFVTLLRSQVLSSYVAEGAEAAEKTSEGKVTVNVSGSFDALRVQAEFVQRRYHGGLGRWQVAESSYKKVFTLDLRRLSGYKLAQAQPQPLRSTTVGGLPPGHHSGGVLGQANAETTFLLLMFSDRLPYEETSMDTNDAGRLVPVTRTRTHFDISLPVRSESARALAQALESALNARPR